MNKNTNLNDDILEKSLKQMSKDVIGDPELLTSILKALPENSKMTSIKSPYDMTAFKKISISAFAVVILAAGGIYFNQYHNALNQNSVSDASINQDMNSIDTQMNGLNSDTAAIDQGLDAQN